MIAMMLSFFLFCSYFVPSKMYLIRPNIQAKRELLVNFPNCTSTFQGLTGTEMIFRGLET